MKNVCNTNSNKCCRSLRPYVNSLYAGSVYIQDTNLVITVPADALAPHGARSSAGTVMATQLDVFSTKCVCLEVMLRYLSWPDDVIQNSWQDLEKSHGTSSVIMHIHTIGWHSEGQTAQAMNKSVVTTRILTTLAGESVELDVWYDLVIWIYYAP